MSPSRLAAAAHISPYQAASFAHLHHQPPSSPDAAANSDNAQQQQTDRQKKTKGRPRQERPAQEGIRFNIGPPRTMLVRRLMRRTRPELLIDPYIMGKQSSFFYLQIYVPDYPPPSFQEAISSPPVSVSSSTATVENNNHTEPNSQTSLNGSLPHQAVARSAEIRERERPLSHPNFTTFDSDSSSDSSHEFVDVPNTRDDDTQASSQARLKQGESSAQCTHGHVFPSARGRARNRSRAILDDFPEEEEEEERPTQRLSTRRHNSLSPLRIFPSIHLTFHDHAATAHPVNEPASSPYALSKGLAFFRSTTSLGLHSTPTLSAKPSLSNLSSIASSKRKLWSSKGKDKPETALDPSTIDSWEIIDASEAEELDEKGAHRCSIASVEFPSIEPFRGQVETAPVAAPVPLVAPTPTVLQTPQQNQNQVHPLSQRDKKTHIPFVERAPRRAPASPPPVAPPSRVVHPSESTTDAGPPITTVRTTRRAGNVPALKQMRSQVLNASPLSIQTWKAEEEPAVTSDSDQSLQQALDTPLPPTPVDSVRSNPNFSSEFESVIAEIAGLKFTPLSDANNAEKRQHYPGRPLPRTPGPPGMSPNRRSPIDSVYLLPENQPEQTETGAKNDVNCPEGLLIDLEDNTFVNRTGSGFSTPETESRSRSQVDLLMPSAAAYGFTGHSISTPSLASPPLFLSPNVSQTVLSLPQVCPTPGAAFPPSAISDLDALLSRVVQNTRQQEQDYESLKCWAAQHLAAADLKSPMHPFALALARAPAHPPPGAMSWTTGGL
ncbi:hypothetical protein AX17_004639 [Amanita inopinata Kibby_2008]|nr:hypothetical protein AX17_004639 [Amanita inopinata Kibby_2008]